MKRTRLGMCALLLSVCSHWSVAQTHTIYDFTSLINHSKQDSIAKIERLAALEFHKLINEYRKTLKIDTIAWNETLWIASRNHCVWMASADQLSHTQKTNNSNFTGTNPGDRYDYASGGKSSYAWSGENALYNYSANGIDANAIAKNIAKASFNQWKQSTGHNRNMMSRSHGMHGTAFIIKDHKVWSTDLFASCTDCPSPYSPPLLANKKEETKPVTTFRKTEPTIKKINTVKTRIELEEKVIQKLSNSLEYSLKRSKKFDNEAYVQAQTLLNKKFSATENETVVLTEAETYYREKLFGLIKKPTVVYSLVMEQSINDFDLEKLSEDIANKVQENMLFSSRQHMGIALAIRKKKDVLRISLVSILG
jgi:uncharacterized protein YkwD